MHIAAVVMVALSIAAGIAEMRDSDPAGRGYALVIPIVFGHIAALIPALIASRSSSRAAIARRAPLRYVLASGFGLLTAGALYPLVPRRGPPPEPPAPTIERVAAALAGMVNAQGAFARITMSGEPGRWCGSAGVMSVDTDRASTAFRVSVRRGPFAHRKRR
jgi:hypothetical protein